MSRAMSFLTATLLAGVFVPAAASGVPAAQQPVPESPVTLTELGPTAIVDTVGTHVGDVGSLATPDQSGTQDDPASYVRFGRGGNGDTYDGYRSYTLPDGIGLATITTVTLAANFRGPTAAKNAWTWLIYDWAADAWIRIGDQDHCGGDTGTEQWPCDDLDRSRWKLNRDNVIHPAGTDLSAYVDPATREIRVRLRAADAGAAKLDAETLEVYSNDGSASAARWTPTVGLRWQWQLEGRVGQHAATGGIAVGICQVPFAGGECVRPDVFDIDLFVDPQIAGRFGWLLATDAVDAIHASGRHVIGYVTQGDAERWRPDYEQFVDFDEHCDGCLLGNPFSKRFPDEYWANFSPGHGRMNFMLQMMRARTDRVAATGFDGIEYDIADTYANGDAPGFHVSAETQLAYNTALTQMAHENGLAGALKNDGGQIPDLVDHYDMAINEQCFQYHECDGYSAFIDAGKPVFEAEYKREPDEFCPEANVMRISAIRKSQNYELFAHPWIPCA
jgi:endo-alpha-1,4-polygalactosaminidase (GH114 family)